MVAATPDPYAHWRARLAGATVPIHAGEPQCGFYRTKIGGAAVAASIFPDPDDGLQIKCIVGTEYEDPHRVWLRLARDPICEEAAQFWFDNGRWLHEPEPAAAPELEAHDNEGVPPASEPAIGHNSGGSGNAACYTWDIRGWVDYAADWLKRTPTIKTSVQADTCGDLIAAARQHHAQAEAARVAEKQPHLDAGRAVDAKWQATLRPLDAVLAGLKALAVAFKQEQDARRAREAAEAERARAEREAEALAQAEAQGLTEPPLLEPEPEPPKQEPVRIGGTSGRRIGFREVKHVVVTDVGKAFRLKAVREDPAVLAAIESVCNRLFKATSKAPSGCELRTETKAA